jgi:hypothetical protein
LVFVIGAGIFFLEFEMSGYSLSGARDGWGEGAERILLFCVSPFCFLGEVAVPL